MRTATLRNVSRNDFVQLPYEHLLHDADGAVSETLAEAVARIGSTEVQLLIEEDITVATSVVIPATLKLRWINGARLVKAESATLTFQGDPFVDGQELSREGLFEGFAAADITFTGDTPPQISSEIAYVAADSLTARLKLLTEWFDGSRVTIFCIERPITVSVRMNDEHSLHFLAGDFTNTWNAYAVGETNSHPFTMGSYSRFTSDAGAIIYESNVAGSSQIVVTKDDCVDCVIERNHFKTVVGAVHDGAASGVEIGPGSTNCHIRFNRFDELVTYHAAFNGSNGNPPKFCSITDNYFYKHPGQIVAMSGGFECTIARNTFDLREAVGTAYFSVVDIEPNAVSETIEGLLIEDNVFDTRDAQEPDGDRLYHTIIIVQGVVTPGPRRVIIRGNRAIGNGDGYLQTFIDCNGCRGLEIYNNTVEDGGGVFIVVTQSRDVRIHDNKAFTGTAATANIYLTAVGNAYVWNNTGTYALATVTEAELRQLAGGNGTDRLQLSHNYGDASDGRVFQSYIGQVVTFQDVDYTVTAATTAQVFQELTVSGGTVPSVGSRNFTDTEINLAANTITIPLHGWVNDQRVYWFSWGSAPAPFVSNVAYYVKVSDANTIQLAAAPGGAAIDITANGSAMHQLNPSIIDASWVNTGTDTIAFTNHQLANYSAVLYYTDGVPIGGLTNNTVYYVIRTDANNFKLATTRANAVASTAIDLTTQGTGVQGVYPVFYTKFSNNKYRNNNFNSYTLMGTSENYGDFDDAPATPSTEVELGMAVSDETTDLATGTAKLTFRMPYAMTLTGVRASVSTAPAGSTIIVDINASGSTILSTKLSIDAGEKTSTTAASAAVISDTSLADDEEITVDIDQVGSGTAGQGLKIWLIGEKL